MFKASGEIAGLKKENEDLKSKLSKAESEIESLKKEVEEVCVLSVASVLALIRVKFS